MPEKQKIYLVQAMHFHVPGMPRSVHSTLAKAQIKALELTNNLRAWVELPPETDPNNWEAAMEAARTKRAADLGHADLEDLEDAPADDGWVEIATLALDEGDQVAAAETELDQEASQSSAVIKNARTAQESDEPGCSPWIHFSQDNLASLRRIIALAAMAPAYAEAAVNRSRKNNPNAAPCTPAEADTFASNLTKDAFTLACKVETFCAPDMHDPQIIARARQLTNGTDLEINDNAIVSESDGGAFVMSWVWVPEAQDASAAREPA